MYNTITHQVMPPLSKSFWKWNSKCKRSHFTSKI